MKKGKRPGRLAHREANIHRWGFRNKATPMHVMTLLLLVITMGMLFACTPKNSENTADGVEDSSGLESTEEASPSIQIDWTPDTDCGVCHGVELMSYDDSATEAAEHQEITCVECHSDTATLQVVHEAVASRDETPGKLKESMVEDGVCFSCHYETREALIEATQGKTMVVDSKGTESNPHDLEGVSDHEIMKCKDCHTMHDAGSVEDRAMKRCVSCHHDNVFECYTCHT